MSYDLYVKTVPILVNKNFTPVGSNAKEGITFDEGYYSTFTSTGSTPQLFKLSDNSNPITLQKPVISGSGLSVVTGKSPLLFAFNEIYSISTDRRFIVFNKNGEVARISPFLIPNQIPAPLSTHGTILNPSHGFPRFDDNGNVIYTILYPAPSIYVTTNSDYFSNYVVVKEYSGSDFSLLRTFTIFFNLKALYPNPTSCSFSYDYLYIGKEVYLNLNVSLLGVRQQNLSGDSFVRIGQNVESVIERKTFTQQAQYFFTNNLYKNFGSISTLVQLNRNIQSLNYGSSNIAQCVSYAPDNRYWLLSGNNTDLPYLYNKGINVGLLIPKTFTDKVNNVQINITSGAFPYVFYNNGNNAGVIWRETLKKINYLFLPFEGTIQQTTPIFNYSLGVSKK